MRRNLIAFAIIALCLFVAVFAAGCVEEDSTEPETDQWRFAVFCDTRGDSNNTSGKSGINDLVVGAIARAIVNDSCDLVLVPGDMANGWCQNGSTPYVVQFTNWKHAMEPVYSAGITVHTIRGNHENGPLDWPHSSYPYTPHPDPALKAAYMDAFGSDNPGNGPSGEEHLTYSFTHKNAFFVGLDTYINPHRVNQEWLEGQMENNSQPYVFVFGHEPAFKVNHPDCMACYPNARDEFWNSIGSAGGRIYFCGHDHLYNRAYVPDDSESEIYQMVVGSCGAPLASWSPPYNDSRVVGEYRNDLDYGYVLVTVDHEYAEVEWIAWDGTGDPVWTTLDNFTLSVTTSPKR